MPFRPKQASEGDELSAKQWNEERQEIAKGLVAMRGHLGVETKQTPGGTIFSVTPERDRIGKTSGTITARSGTTLGTGTVRLYVVNYDATISDSGIDVTVKNYAGSTISTDKYVMLGIVDGLWLIKNAEC